MNHVHIITENEEITMSPSTSLATNIKSLQIDLGKCNLIPVDCLVCYEKLGSGQFGDVFRGTYKHNVGNKIMNKLFV